MDVDHIRKIDKWLGIPMCAFFTVLYKIRTLFKPSLQKPVQPKNILFVELSEMGSAILAYSALQKTKELFPDSNIYFLIFEENKKACTSQKRYQKKMCLLLIARISPDLSFPPFRF